MSYILNTKDASEYSPKGLPLPVVIPQQRPGSKERGFIAAYAPSLEHCGIDQSTFLHFVDDCNKALLGNKWLGAVQVVSLGVAFTPELIVMGVATAIQAGATIANRSHVKSKFVPSTLGSQGHAIDVATNRTNSVIDRYNNQLFRPNGLFCMIVNYDPQQKAECRQSSPRPYQRPLPIGPLTRLSGRFQHPTVGCPEDPQKLPTEVAPLRYIDDRRHFKEMMGQGEPKCQSQEGKKSGRQRVKDALAAYNDYLDRRARARYTAENEGDVMNVPLSRGFKNRYLDPNHPATNGGISGLLSGGYLTQSPDTRKRNSLRQIDDEERRVQEEYQRQIDSIYRQNRSPFEVDRQLRQREEEYWRRLDDMQRRREQVEERERHIKNNVFYLAIVNMPSESELAAANAQLETGCEYGVIGAADM